jgi:hypothetical protein
MKIVQQLFRPDLKGQLRKSGLMSPRSPRAQVTANQCFSVVVKRGTAILLLVFVRIEAVKRRGTVLRFAWASLEDNHSSEWKGESACGCS